MAFRVNGVSTIITTDGLVGLGTTTPTSNIQLTVNSPNDVIKITQTGAGAALNVAAGNVSITNELIVYGKLNVAGDIVSAGANTVWHSGNDGSGSGLDADLLDGNNSNFFTNSTNQTVGTLPSGRLTGAYTGITQVGSLTDLSANGNTNISSATLYVDGVGFKVGIWTHEPEVALHVKNAGKTALFETDSNTSSAPVVTIRGRQAVGVGTQYNFSGKLALERFTTNATTASGTILGTILFGGNHSNNTTANIEYSSSIRGIAEGGWASNSDMGIAVSIGTDLIGRTSVENSATPVGIERLRIHSNGLSRFSNTLIVNENFSVAGRANITGAMNVTGELASATGIKVGANTVWHSGNLDVGANTVWHSGNDGSGSGLDADLLDGNNSGVFTNSTNQTVGTLPSGRLTGAYTGVTGVGTLTSLVVSGNTSIDTNVLHVDSIGNKVSIGKVQPNSTLDVVGSVFATVNIKADGAMIVGSNTVWHQGNDGILSGLDADLLDGLDSTYFLNANNLSTGTVPSARLAGAYTGITGLGTQSSLAVSGNTTIDTNVLHVDTVGNRVGIGKVQPNSTLDVVGTINATSEIASATGFKVASNTVWHSGNLDIGSNTAWHSGNDGSGSGLDADLLDGNNSNFFTNSTNQTTGTLPSGRLAGAYTGITELGTQSSLAVSGNTTIDTNVLHVDTVGNRVGIGKVQPNSTLDVVGTITVSANITSPNITTNNMVVVKINDGTVGGFKNIIHNPFGLVQQRSNKIVAGDGYIGLFDRWFSSRSNTGQIKFVALPQEQNGIPAMMRLWNTAIGTNQRLAFGQIILANDTIQLRGRSVTLSAYIRRKGSTACRMAILEWTGPQDTPNRNVVSEWANTQFNPSGGFFSNTNINVLAETSVTPGAQTLGQMTLTGTVSTNCNNLIVFAWSFTNEAASIGHLDIAAQLTASDTAETYFEYRPYHIELDICKKFYERIGGYDANTPIASGFADTTTAGLFPISFSEKRTDTVNLSSSGSFTIRAAGADVPVSAITISDTSRGRALVNATASGLTVGHGVMLKANNSASTYIEIDAEI